jgi:16S rRNA (adenine1518-N6/adenine1519-N6)-dimethyltransferase
MSSLKDLYTAIETNRLRDFTIKTLRQLNLRPSKKLGQNFTIDPRLVKEIFYRASEMRCTGRAVDIGAGLGVLTSSLIEICGRIIAIEKDPRLCRFLRELFSVVDNVEVICGDVLEIFPDINPDHVIGTIPYSITGKLLGEISFSKVSWAVLALQKDVVDRIISNPGSRRYGSITVLLKIFFEQNLGGVYPPESFYPAPEVFTQIIVLKRVREWRDLGIEIQNMLKCLFSQRRKNLYNALEICRYNVSEELDEDLLRKKVFQLAPEDFIRLYRKIFRKHD